MGKRVLKRFLIGAWIALSSQVTHITLLQKSHPCNYWGMNQSLSSLSYVKSLRFLVSIALSILSGPEVSNRETVFSLSWRLPSQRSSLSTEQEEALSCRSMLAGNSVCIVCSTTDCEDGEITFMLQSRMKTTVADVVHSLTHSTHKTRGSQPSQLSIM